MVSEQQKSKKRSTISSRFGQPLRQPNPPQRTSYPIRSPQRAIFPRRTTNDFPRPVPQRTQTPSVQYSFEQLSNEKNQTNNQQIQAPDLRNRINEIQRAKQPTPVVDLTVDSDSDVSNSRHPDNNNFVKKTPPISPKRIESQPAQKDTPQTTARMSSYVHPPLLENNPFFDTNKPPQITRMQDRLKHSPKWDSQSQNNVTMESNSRNVPKSVSHIIVNKNIGTNERRSVQDRLASARQQPSVATANVSSLTFRCCTF